MMNRYSTSGLLTAILLFSLTGFCIADETPMFLAQIQGGESGIAGETDEMMVITIENYAPYFNITEGNATYSMPLEHLTTISWPLHAAILFADDEEDTVCLVTVANLSVSEEENLMMLHVAPLPFYEGELLTPLAEEFVELDTMQGETFNNTVVYLEMPRPKAENEPLCCPGGYWLETDRCCREEGQGNILCYWDRFVSCS
ncbi:MAG: hypothetical protein JXA44_00155 [Methanospirillaceae archaeon]|nr:hypothetical protein [Methanospirillaceae archaeon]